MTTPTLFTAPLGNVNWRCPHKGCPGHHDWRVGDVPLRPHPSADSNTAAAKDQPR